MTARRFARADADLPPLAREIAPWDTQSIIYTSGTTGPSKAWMSSYLQLYSMGAESLFFAGHDDRCMVNLPLFHVGGTAAVYAMLAKGGSIAVVDAFDTARFWSTVRETGTTTGDPARRHGGLPREAGAVAAGPGAPVAHRHHGAARRGRTARSRGASAATSTPSST